ncbi:MAG: purine-cytosine permease [Phylliscum demangeonii]|nr:MAG: purine-cytosine permease [Phylliscum demangeonii]
MGLKEDELEKGVGQDLYVPSTDAPVPGKKIDVGRDDGRGDGDGLLAKLHRFAARARIETRGIERVPEDERTDPSPASAGTMWFSANLVVTALALGALGPQVFQLGFVDSVLTIFFVTILGILPVSFFSTFGPRFGLRQMVLSRYWFGYNAVKIIAVFNIIACIGWSAVNVIVGAQLFNAVNHRVPGYAGIIIIAAATFLVTVFGYKVVHLYERWSWMPSLAIFMIVLGEFAHAGGFRNVPMGSGSVEAASVLSFAASVFGFATGWTSYAADYTVYQPAGQNRWKIFIWTFSGLALPLWFTEMLGAAIMTAAQSTPSYQDGYSHSGIGGLLAAVLFPPLGRFGQFCLVILALSIIANNCPNIYSVSLSLQVLARQSQMVPRFVWTFIATLVYCAIAIPGYSHFETVLENFLLLIAYWLASYEAISLTEHFVFKKGFVGYDLQIYDQPSRLPPGFAASLAFCFGVFGAVMGLAQPWYVGPVGKRIGLPALGGDVGFELAFGFAVVAYLPLRWLEFRSFRR